MLRLPIQLKTMVRRLWATACILSLATGICPAQTDRHFDSPPTELATAAQFQTALKRSISASWNNVPLRQVINRISADQHIAILLDRRIDPTQEPKIEVQQTAVLAAITDIAHQVGAEVSLLGNVVYIGPPAAVAKLRTLAEIRSQEAFAAAGKIPATRRLQLAGPHTWHWQDFDRPRDLVAQFSAKSGLEVKNSLNVPHDLWAAGTLPKANIVDALSLLLIQFDMTFQWADQLDVIELIEAPAMVAIEKTHIPRGLSPQVAAERCRQEIPGLTLRISGRQLVVEGTVEQQEAVARLIRPQTRRATTPRPTVPLPLNRREFTLRVKNVPAQAVMEKLESTGVTFAFDEQRLRAAGIDLQQKIDLDVKKASAEELFQALFAPIGVKFTIDGTNVQLDVP